MKTPQKLLKKFMDIADAAILFSSKNPELTIGEINDKLNDLIHHSKTIGVPLHIQTALGCLHMLCTSLCRDGKSHIPHRIQLASAAALYMGAVINMENGEGKTLAAALAAVLSAKMGRSVHISTSNNYLVRRDATWMYPLYDAVGLKVTTREDTDNDLGFFVNGNDFHDVSPINLIQVYEGDIVYAHRKRLGYDFLKNNTVETAGSQFQRNLDFVIIDEVDNTLIDDAREPLSISAKSTTKNPSERKHYYHKAWELSGVLIQEKHFEIANYRIFLTEEGQVFAADKLETFSIYNDPRVLWIKLIILCLRARYVLKEGNDYVRYNGSICPVDATTGRIEVGHIFADGLQQVLLVKENLGFIPETEAVAQISVQNYYLQYKDISGMSGSVWPAREEIESVYGVPVIKFPTQLKNIRKDKSTLILRTQRGRNMIAFREAIKCSDAGQPVLIGVEDESVAKDLLKIFKDYGLAPAVLTATEHEAEARKLAELGQPGQIMISAKLAGRGTDIKLSEVAISRGGLHVIVVGLMDERLENQLRGRAGRQGSPGSSSCIVSLEDKMMQRINMKNVSRLMTMMGLDEEEVISSSLTTISVIRTRRKLLQIDFYLRNGLYEADSVIEGYRKYFYTIRRGLLEDTVDHQQLLHVYIRNTVERYFEQERHTFRRNIDEATSQVISSLRNDFPGLPLTVFSNIGKVAGWKERVKEVGNRFENYIKGLNEKIDDIGGSPDESFDPSKELLRLCILRSMDKAWSLFISKTDQMYAQANRRNIGRTWLGSWIQDRAHRQFLEVLSVTEKSSLYQWVYLVNKNDEFIVDTLLDFYERNEKRNEFLLVTEHVAKREAHKNNFFNATNLFLRAAYLFEKDQVIKAMELRFKAVCIAFEHPDRQLHVELVIETIHWSIINDIAEIHPRVYNFTKDKDPELARLIKIIQDMLNMGSHHEQTEFPFALLTKPILDKELVETINATPSWHKMADLLTDKIAIGIEPEIHDRFSQKLAIVIKKLVDTSPKEGDLNDLSQYFGDVFGIAYIFEEDENDLETLSNSVFHTTVLAIDAKIQRTAYPIRNFLYNESKTKKLPPILIVTFSDGNEELKVACDVDKLIVDGDEEIKRALIIHAYRLFIKKYWLQRLNLADEYMDHGFQNHPENPGVFLKILDLHAIPFIVKALMITDIS